MKREEETTMKRWAAVAVILLTLCTGAAVSEGRAVRFDDGFEFTLPSDWVQLDVSEAMGEAGIVYAAASGDGRNTVQVSWSDLGERITAGQVYEELAAVYSDTRIIEINDIAVVGFTDTANDAAGFAMVDAAGTGLRVLFLAPESDEAFVDTAVEIAMSIRYGAQ